MSGLRRMNSVAQQPSEHDEQKLVIRWCGLQGREPLKYATHIFAIPNGGDRNPIVGAKLKAEGVRSGVPDLFLPVVSGNYGGLFIEMKKIGGDPPTVNQRGWLAVLGALGYRCQVCYGADAAIEAIGKYLHLGVRRPGEGGPI